MSASRLNTIGVVTLFLGLGSALLLYRQTRPAATIVNTEWKDSTLSLTDSKSNTRNIELYGGKLEVLMVKFLNWLHRPESLAIIIVTISALISLGCFLTAVPRHHETGNLVERGKQ